VSTDDGSSQRRTRERITQIRELLARDAYPVDVDQLAARIVDEDTTKIPLPPPPPTGD
jgi:hypothetical protein